MSYKLLRAAVCAGIVLLLGTASVAQDTPPVPLKAGTAAPLLSAPSINGKGPISLRALRGKVILLDFWATWCPPCQAATPTLEALSRQYAKQGLVVVGINTDSPDTVAHVPGFLKHFHMTYPVATLSPAVIKSARAYNVEYLPALFLIDRGGIVRWSQSGFGPDEDTTLPARVRQLLAKH